MKNNKYLNASATVVVLSGLGGGCFAEDTDPSTVYSAFTAIESGIDLVLPDDQESKDTRIRIGAGFGALPDFVGASGHRFKVVPIIDIRYKKKWRLNHNRLSYSAYGEGGWEMGPFIKYKSGRREKRSPLLEGLEDIKATAQLGFFTKYKTDRMLLNMEYRHALGSGQGDSISATFGHALCKFGDFVMAAAIAGKWQSKKSMQTNFGVTEVQANRSVYGLDAFEANSGVSKMSLNLLGRYSIGKRYRILALARYGRLMGDAANSPLVIHDMGSRSQFKAGVGFTVDF